MSQNPADNQGGRGTPPARARVSRGTVVALAVGALLLGSLALGPVRAVAAQMLGIFRVQRMQTISITQADLEKVGQVLSEGDGKVSLESLGDVSVEGASTEPSETTLKAAQAAVDFDIKVPTGAEGTPTVVLQQPMTMKFKLHVDKVNELLDSYGATKLFSNSLDGKEFSIFMPATVVLAYPDKVANASDSGKTDPDGTALQDAALYADPMLGVVVVQTRGPQLNVPPGVDPLEIRDVVLGLPFLPENVRSQLAGVQDWRSTLLIPSVEGTSREISVGGMPGVIVAPNGTGSADPSQTALADESPVVVMWNDNGVMRAVGGAGGEQRVLTLAESVTR